MAEERQKGEYEGGETEVKDRGLFDFMGKKEEEKKPCEEEVIVSEFKKVQVSEPEHGLLEKLHRSGSSSSSSSSDEEEVEGEKKVEKKKKKGLKEKIKDKVSRGDDHKEEVEEEKYEDTSVPVEKYEEVVPPQAKKYKEVVPPQAEPEVPAEEKKGFLDKIKDKLRGGHKKQAEEVVVFTAPPLPPLVGAGRVHQPRRRGQGEEGQFGEDQGKAPRVPCWKIW